MRACTRGRIPSWLTRRALAGVALPDWSRPDGGTSAATTADASRPRCARSVPGAECSSIRLTRTPGQLLTCLAPHATAGGSEACGVGGQLMSSRADTATWRRRPRGSTRSAFSSPPFAGDMCRTSAHKRWCRGAGITCHRESAGLASASAKRLGRPSSSATCCLKWPSRRKSSADETVPVRRLFGSATAPSPACAGAVHGRRAARVPRLRGGPRPRHLLRGLRDVVASSPGAGPLLLRRAGRASIAE